MSACIKFHTETPLIASLRQLLRLLEERLELNEPLNVYLAGGIAAHLYTAERSTTDVDAEFSERVLLPEDLMVEVDYKDGSKRMLYWDTNYNATFALMHEDYLIDAIPVDLGLNGNIKTYVLAPVDLAVSKISRLGDNDKKDIAALVRLGLTTADAIEQRANEAVGGYIGGMGMIKLSIRDAVALARQAEQRQPG